MVLALAREQSNFIIPSRLGNMAFISHKIICGYAYHVKTQFGYHLIKLNSKTESEKPVFDKVKDKVKKDLSSQLQRETYLAKVNEMRKKFLVEMF